MLHIPYAIAFYYTVCNPLGYIYIYIFAWIYFLSNAFTIYYPLSTIAYNKPIFRVFLFYFPISIHAERLFMYIAFYV